MHGRGIEQMGTLTIAVEIDAAFGILRKLLPADILVMLFAILKNQQRILHPEMAVSVLISWIARKRD